MKMDEEAYQQCSNCKRDILVHNFVLHSAYCARNLRACAACGEPVPLADMQRHHETMHKPAPCPQCGDTVPGMDLPDHVRDSCALTPRQCRYCELELPRAELPPHEEYCGARTEQCAACRQWVPLRHRQLHRDSGHELLRPEPAAAAAAAPGDDTKNAPNLTRYMGMGNGFVRPPNAPAPAPAAGAAPTRSVAAAPTPTPAPTTTPTPTPAPVKLFNSDRNMQAKASYLNSGTSGPDSMLNDRNGSERTWRQPQYSAGAGAGLPSRAAPEPEPHPGATGAAGARPHKRTNDRPQVNTDVAPSDKVDKILVSRRAVKKRPAPRPPAPAAPGAAPAAPADPVRQRAYHSALLRQQAEERQRREANEINAALGLPPVLSAAEKVERLRRMDRLLAAPPDAEPGRSGRLRGRVWGAAAGAGAGAAPAGHVLGAGAAPAGHVLGAGAAPAGHVLGAGAGPSRHVPGAGAGPSRHVPGAGAGPSRHVPGAGAGGSQLGREDFKDLTPMTHEEFMNRFQELQLSDPPAGVAGGGTGGEGEGGGGPRARGADRFGDIKSSLSQLRRGLNEIRYSYDNPGAGGADSNPRRERASPPGSDSEVEAEAQAEAEPEGGVLLPCEFCARPVPAHRLVLHQTGCRPDLAQLRASPAPRPASPPRAPDAAEPPVIPCEFCTESLPVYLYSEHQRQCRPGRASLLYPD